MAVEVITAVAWCIIVGIVTLVLFLLSKSKDSTNERKEKESRLLILQATEKRLSEYTEPRTAPDEIKESQQQKKSTEEGLSESKTGIDDDDRAAKHVGKPFFGKSDTKKFLSNEKTRRIPKIFLKRDPAEIANRRLDNDTSQPICQPLRDINEVHAWMPGFDHFNVANEPLRETRRESLRKPKTLVCHDMRGGYTEDRFVQGFNAGTCYNISQWNFVDTFVYFSHNLVTIPPPSWTNTCHRHGVKVLGTFITEWEDGAKCCSDILATKGSYTRFAEKLVEIACYYQFDGWLVNIENPIQASQIDNLVGFLGLLTASMHTVNPGSQVIWYDSVTVEGELKWQNELNSKNSKFFDVCDGIFLNYTWSVHHLSRSSVVAGRERNFDVYVGVDCFGRGCFGGGGWNTYKALQVIREQNLSVAIFAPGWVLETQGEESFRSNQDKFWRLIAPYLHRHFPVTLPIVSSFCQGYGKYYFSNGKKIMFTGWSHLSCQQLQPSFSDEYFILGPRKGIEVRDIAYCTDDGFQGGGCLKIEGAIDENIGNSRAIFRLFRCNCNLESQVLVSLTFKVISSRDIQVYLLLLLEGKPNYIVLAPQIPDEGPADMERVEESETIQVGSYTFNSSRQVDSFNDSFPVDSPDNYMMLQPLHGENEKNMNSIFGRENSTWKTRYYMLPSKNLRVLKEIRVACAPSLKPPVNKRTKPFALKIGEILVHSVRDLAPRFPVLCNVRFTDTAVEDKGEIFILNTTIVWDSLGSSEEVTVVSHYNIFCKGIDGELYSEEELGRLLGKAFTESFRATKLTVPKTPRGNLVFYLQPVSNCYLIASKEDCGIVILEW